MCAACLLCQCGYAHHELPHPHWLFRIWHANLIHVGFQKWKERWQLCGLVKIEDVVQIEQLVHYLCKIISTRHYLVPIHDDKKLWWGCTAAQAQEVWLSTLLTPLSLFFQMLIYIRTNLRNKTNYWDIVYTRENTSLFWSLTSLAAHRRALMNILHVHVCFFITHLLLHGSLFWLAERHIWICCEVKTK